MYSNFLLKQDALLEQDDTEDPKLNNSFSLNQQVLPVSTASNQSKNLITSGQHRRIFICCDGTWNDRETNQPLTNVTRIQSCLAVRDTRGYEQLSYYIDGIGAGTTWGGAIHDGSTGSGIERKIREAYRHLCLTYTDKKDEIVLIGFSRGAFTVRCLAWLIHDVGLLEGAWVNKELPTIFELWKKQTRAERVIKPSEREPSALEKHCQELIAKYDKPSKQSSRDERKGSILRRGVSIKACAVWDTVKSLGFPWPKRVPHKESKKYDFVDQRLTPNIENAFQALSLDERRWHFPPVIWSISNLDQALKQCWFLGSHSDIGGGYRNAGFANISLCWMISQLRHLVVFNEKAISHSTETGSILGINVAKENRELFELGRGRIQAKSERNVHHLRSTSGPSGKMVHPDNQNRSLPLSRYLPWSRDARLQRVTNNFPAKHLDIPLIAVSQDAVEGESNTQDREFDDMYEPDLPVPPESSINTPYEASLNPEAEVSRVREEPDRDLPDAPNTDELEQPSLAIKNIRRHTWRGLWVLGGSKIRQVGKYRGEGDDFRSSSGQVLPDRPYDHFGSNETIHFSVRVLTELYPLKGRTKCKALQGYTCSSSDGRTHVWRRKVSLGSFLVEMPEDTAIEYEQLMLHRWLDRDFEARETLGGQKASEAIAGAALSAAQVESVQPEQNIPSSSRSSLYATGAWSTEPSLPGLDRRHTQ